MAKSASIALIVASVDPGVLSWMKAYSIIPAITM